VNSSAITANRGEGDDDCATAAPACAVDSAGAGGCVQGKCVDCSSPHDTYSGRIVCTVCRMPVLVCPTCVSSNVFIDEYYCTRHRKLKGLYFTVLERFHSHELQEQREQLRCLMMEYSTKKDKYRRRTLEKQISKIDERLATLANGESANSSSTASNPKAMSGWGFWRS